MKTKLTNEEQVVLIKDDLRRDLETITSADMKAYADDLRDLIARTDWTAEQFIHNRIPPAPSKSNN